MKNINQLQYIERLCTIAREKSLLGQQSEAAQYFVKAIERANTEMQFLCISWEIYRSDITNNKHYAYITFIRAIEVARDSFMFFQEILNRKDLVSMVSEFMLKMPDHLFHYLKDKCQTEKDKRAIAKVFLPMSNFISDPDPTVFAGTSLRTAS